MNIGYLVQRVIFLELIDCIVEKMNGIAHSSREIENQKISSHKV
jgi:hypothetical protein